MKIFQSNLHLITRDGIQLFPFQRYLLPTAIAREIEQQILGQSPTYTLSDFNSYERRYSGQDLNGKRLLVYRHGAIGDTLMATALVAWLRAQYPKAVIDLYCRPLNVELWHGVGCRAMPGYPAFDAATKYDYHLLFENMLECNSEPDQGCATDDQFSFAGVDPLTVPDAAKVPKVVEMENDDALNPAIGKSIVVHCNASNPNRNHPGVSAIVARLRDGISYDCSLVLVGDDSGHIIHKFAKCYDIRGETPRFRNLIPIIKNASLVICPDSSVGHLAAAFPSVPVISLWGLFDPNDRVKYYKNHYPLTAPGSCPHMPCRSHLFTLPINQCKDAPGFNEKSCAALAAITPERIVAKARELLGL